MPSTLATIAKTATNLPALATAEPRFIVSLDATISRADTWREARAIQAQLFKLMASSRAPLDIRLSHFGGGKFAALDWTDDLDELQDYMAAVRCKVGGTQIADVLDDAFNQTIRRPVSALIYTGDACEEKAAHLYALAGQLKCVGLPVFMFHERGSLFERKTEKTFREIAAITGGAYARFEPGAFRDLAALLKVAMAASAKNAALLAKVRADQTLTGPARLLLADLSRR